jgi:acetolactate decarboxylase
MSKFFQVGVVAGFLQGIYDGDYKFSELAQQGDIGLGTVNKVDGEMIAVDGKFYRVDANGVAELIQGTQGTPFAVVSQFKIVPQFHLKDIPDLNALSEELDKHIESPNIFYMIRIDGEMEWIHLRSEHCQIRKYRPLAETLPKLQTTFELKNSHGTLVVTRAPNYSSGVTISGYHYHYLNAERSTGGHVFDLKLKTAQVMINPLRRFEMALYDTQEFDEADLSVDTVGALQKIE